jgi:hypothetical protein
MRADTGNKQIDSIQIGDKNGVFAVDIMNRIRNLMNLVEFTICDVKYRLSLNALS